MPYGFPSAEYDTLRVRPEMRGYSRALREFTIPVQDTLKASRGIQVVQFGFPDPCRSSKCALLDDYCGQELGVPTSVLTLYVTDLGDLGNGPGAPPPMIIQVRQGVSQVTTVRFTGTLLVQNYNYKDLVVQVSGLQGTQWEIWTRIAPVPGFAIAPVRMSMSAVLSLFDGKRDHIFLGPDFTASPP